MHMEIISVNQLGHTYNNGRNWAIRDIGFTIGASGVVALLGANGAGKSTLMNIICGVINQTQGDVVINGVNTRRRSREAKRHLGFLPQTPPVYSDLTVDEYLTHCARIRLMEKAEIPGALKRVKDQVNIGHFSKRLIRNLSGGYRQRVGIAQAIIHQPSLVVLDEPTVGLDPNQIIEVRNLVKEIARDKAVLYSTHILPEVEMMCREVLMIDSGKILFAGSLDSFREIEVPDTVLLYMNRKPDENLLLSIEGVVSVKNTEGICYRVGVENRKGITEKLLHVAVEQGWGLQEIHYEKKSLDDVFTRLTKPALRSISESNQQ